MDCDTDFVLSKHETVPEKNCKELETEEVAMDCNTDFLSSKSETVSENRFKELETEIVKMDCVTDFDLSKSEIQCVTDANITQEREKESQADLKSLSEKKSTNLKSSSKQNIGNKIQTLNIDAVQRMMYDDTTYHQFCDLASNIISHVREKSNNTIRINVLHSKLPQLPEVSATCLPCCKTLKLSHASEKYFYITDIINRKHPHFKLHNKCSDFAGLSTQSKINTFFKVGEASLKMSDDSQHQKKHQLPSTQTQHECIGFGSKIGINLFNANEAHCLLPLKILVLLLVV